MKKWNMSNRCIDEVSALISHQLPPEALSWSDVRIRRFITGVRPELLDDFLALAEAEILCAKDPGLLDKALAAGRENSGDRTGHAAGWAGHGGSKQSRIERDKAAWGQDADAARNDFGDERARSCIERQRYNEVSRSAAWAAGGEGPQSLFEMVLADPELNTREHLTRIVLAKFK